MDDTAIMRDLLSYFVKTSPDLELAGYAQDGQQAVEMAARLRPDLVIMDIRMPVMDGLEATRLIKQAPGAPLVVMLSVDDRAANRAAAQTVGADDFLSKDQLHSELNSLRCRLLRSAETGALTLEERGRASAQDPARADARPTGAAATPVGGYARALNRVLAPPGLAGLGMKGRP